MRQKQKNAAVTLNIPDIFYLASQVVDYNARVVRTFKVTNPFKDLKYKFQNKFKIPSFVKNLFTKRNGVITVAALLILIAAVGIVKLKAKASSSVFSSTTQTDFSPQSSQAINKKFDLPIRKTTGDATQEKLLVTLTTLDKANRILYQGQPATARAGQTFIIINMEVENSTKNQLTISPVNFVRLVDSQGKNLAPDVYNTDVPVEPVSVKKTRVGFVVDANQKSFKFLVGEVNGDKQQEVNLSL